MTPLPLSSERQNGRLMIPNPSMGGCIMMEWLTVVALAVNFIAVLVTLFKMNRQMDDLHRILRAIEKEVLLEDKFVVKINDAVARLEVLVKALKAEVKWEG